MTPPPLLLLLFSAAWLAALAGVQGVPPPARGGGGGGGGDDSGGTTTTTIPQDFFLGTATSSYQVEGAWNLDGKGENIWDRFTHEYPEFIADGSNGDVACNSYFLYRRDVDMLQELNVDSYRFSISWARILPEGDVNRVNRAGVDYYNTLINLLLSKRITPIVTMYHWDLPQKLQSIGGWTNPLIVNYFVRYAKLLFGLYGDRVKWWITFNEPHIFSLGYTRYGFFAPNANTSQFGEYFLTENVLRAHALAYRLYSDLYRDKQKGKVGITNVVNWAEPSTNSRADVEASERALQFLVGTWAHPIFTRDGDYPEIVKRRVAELSRLENRVESRLPELSKKDIKLIRGTADFFGLNHYRTSGITARDNGNPFLFLYDAGAYANDTKPPRGFVYAEGFRKVLNWVTREYPGYPILVTENGDGDSGGIEDDNRVEYFLTYISSMIKALKYDRVPVIGYMAWSLMDNFEWNAGYTEKFGVYHVDFNDTDRPRTPKRSAKVLSDLYRTRKIPKRYS